MAAPTTLGGAGMAAAGTFPVGGSSDPLIPGMFLFLDADLIKAGRLQVKSLQFNDEIGAGDTLEFLHQILAGGAHLKVGQRVILRQDTVNIFRGTVNGIEEVKVPGSAALFTRVEAVDLTKILEHRLVTAAEVYTNQTAGFIARDLVTKYLTNEGITTNSVQDGQTLSAFSIKAFTKVSKALKDLGDRTAFIMFVDAGSDLHFEAQTAKLAPFAVGAFGSTGGALLDSGTAQAGSSNTLTLRAAAPASLPVDSVLRLPTGPGSVQERPVSAYDGVTKVATVSPRWRTNLLLRSEALDSTGAGEWQHIPVTGSITVAADVAVAPDGTTSAEKVNLSGVLNNRIDQTTGISATGAGAYTFSIHLKGSGQIAISINTTTGIGGTAEAEVTLTSEWQRFSVMHTFDGTATGNIRVHALIDRVGGRMQDIFAWGAQIEANAALGDYIKTEAAAITLPDATTGYEVREPNEIPLDDVSVNQIREKYRNRQTIRYGSDLSLSVTRDDLTEQAARKAVEGTSGIYHAVQDEREITTAGEATDLADALLRRFKIPTAVRFSTRRRGLKAGQSITLTFPEHNVSGTHLIDKVSVRDDGTDQLMWDVTTLSGEHLGDVMEFWRRLAEEA